MRIFATSVALLFLMFSFAQSEEDFNEAGRLGYAYWDCAAHGYLLEEIPDTAQKLFEAGYEKIGIILQGAIDGKLTKENTKDVPIGLSWYFVSGPNIDFSLGYMWAKFSEGAYEQTWPEFETPSFDEQKELQRLGALQAFQDKNCELLVK